MARAPVVTLLCFIVGCRRAPDALLPDPADGARASSAACPTLLARSATPAPAGYPSRYPRWSYDQQVARGAELRASHRLPSASVGPTGYVQVLETDDPCVTGTLEKADAATKEDLPRVASFTRLLGDAFGLDPAAALSFRIASETPPLLLAEQSVGGVVVGRIRVTKHRAPKEGVRLRFEGHFWPGASLPPPPSDLETRHAELRRRWIGKTYLVRPLHELHACDPVVGPGGKVTPCPPPLPPPPPTKHVVGSLDVTVQGDVEFTATEEAFELRRTSTAALGLVATDIDLPATFDAFDGQRVVRAPLPL